MRRLPGSTRARTTTALGAIVLAGAVLSQAVATGPSADVRGTGTGTRDGLQVPSAAPPAAAATATPPAQADAANLARQVTIRRDTYGIPHILARSEEAAAFALGYAQMEDHGLPLVRRILQATGETAAIGGGDVETDLLLKRFNSLDEATKQLAVVGPEYRRVLAAFAAGVNRYVAAHRAEMPSWVRELTAADILAHSRMDAVTGIQSIERALRRKYEPPAAPGTTAPAGRADDEGGANTGTPREADGSNAFALAGSRTTSGRPILVGNPHLNWNARYWEAQITVVPAPGQRPRVNFYGSTLVGLPVLRAGFNDRVGYVQTNNAPDLEDVLAVTIDPSAPTQYLFDGRSRPFTTSTVPVDATEKDGAPKEGAAKPAAREYWDTHLGPVIYRTSTQAFVLRSAMLQSWRYFEGFHELMKTASLREFQAVLGRHLIPTSNFTYADADGHIFYQWNANLPRRPDDGMRYELDVPAADDRHAWTALHPVTELPRLLDPPGGYVQNANNAPWFTSTRDRIDPDAYPSYVERTPLALRPQRALQMFDATPKFSVDDAIALKFDTHVLLADRILPDLFAAGKAVSSPSDDLREALDVLARWDRRADAASVGAVLFFAFTQAYNGLVPEPYAVPWNAAQPMTTPRGLANPGAALAALSSSARAVKERHGSMAVAWGAVNRFRFKDIDLPGNGASGTFGVYRVMQFNAPNPTDAIRIAGRDETDPDDPRLTGFGDAWVLLVHFTSPVQAQSVLAYGQNHRAGSPHGRDQIALFAVSKLRKVWFTEAEIKANLEREYRP